MKNLFTLIVYVLLAGSLLSSRHAVAQAPDKMSYQAVIRDTQGNLVTGENVGMKISILQGSVEGVVVYSETRILKTNSNGLVTFEIGGEGVTAVSGVFSAIDWFAGPRFIKTETDPSGGTDYTITGISQLLSVPYAFHAKTAETISEPIVESDPVFEASPAAGIAAADIVNWDEAYLWGDHTEEDYLSEESDPTVPDHVKAITKDNVADWNEAHLWGNHADSRYIATETDPTFTRSEAVNITARDISNLSNLSGVNTGDQDISGIAANTQAIQDTALQIRADIPMVKTYSVGDFAQGGIVFWVDETGQHGLVAAKEDQSTGIKWRGGSTSYSTMARGRELYAGKMNTSIIIAVHSAKDDFDNHAALVCANYTGGNFGDWYLPSTEELNLMYINRTAINNTATANGGSAFVSGGIWSSSEGDGSNVWLQNFGDGAVYFGSKFTTLRVRAIRAF